MDTNWQIAKTYIAHDAHDRDYKIHKLESTMTSHHLAGSSTIRGPMPRYVRDNGDPVNYVSETEFEILSPDVFRVHVRDDSSSDEGEYDEY